MAFDEEFVGVLEPYPLFDLLECLAIEERYRSGHNGAASKADGRKPRGFESRPLRLSLVCAFLVAIELLSLGFAPILLRLGDSMLEGAKTVLSFSSFSVFAFPSIVLVVDEAHLLENNTLQEIRLFTSAEFDRTSPLILFMAVVTSNTSKVAGQEALNQRLRFPQTVQRHAEKVKSCLSKD